MKDLNDRVFISLFKEACRKCFGQLLNSPLSEADSKLLSNAIFQQTGLVIGIKSIKNYSQYVFNPGEAKKENPSTATLDTLARYVLDAPETDEIKRKNQESHHPYWFQYRSRFLNNKPANNSVSGKKILLVALPLLVLVIVFVAVKNFPSKKESVFITDEFHNVTADSLKAKGWYLKNESPVFWNRRNEAAGHLSLYTLIGDNWPDAAKVKQAGIKNLLYRRINNDCFSAEIHLSNFIPHQSWQQAGILLSEDSTFSGKALRLSIGYNNFFGGYSKPAEVIIQAVGSSVEGSISRPEEIAHVNLFSGEPRSDSLIISNLSKSALKIEKKGNQYRFLYSTGRMESFAFKEAAHGDFDINPKYIGIFAMQGLADTEKSEQVLFDSFSLIPLDCEK